MHPIEAIARHHVTAVLVAHDGERWLPEALAALARQVRKPNHVVAVDTGSTDGTAALLAADAGVDAVRTLPRRTGFAAAVAAGLAHAEGTGASTAPDQRSWVWLLHDDCAPDPDALRVLLEQGELEPSAGVLGPKVRDWRDPQALLEVGLTTDRAGRRETGLERLELDQGQHDGVRDVLAVGTAGALVRRELWDRLDGLDQALPIFGDDIDLGWRANLAGDRVLVVPDAVVHHAAAATAGLRPLAATGQPTRRARRRSALYAVLVNAPLLGLLVLLPRLLLGATLGGLGRLAFRRPGEATDELLAVAGVLAHPLRLLRGRWARRRTRTLPARAAHHLLADRRLRWRRYGDAVAGWGSRLSSPAPARGGYQRAGAPEPGPAGWLRGLLGRPAVLLGLVLLGLTFVTSHSLLHDGSLAGGRLLPVPSGASDLWGSYLAPWHAVGSGTPAAAPPYLALLAALAVPLLGRAPLAVDVLLLGCVPLAGLTAYAASRRLTTRVPLRLWAAAAYALLPATTGALAGGRLDVSAAIVVLPLVLAAAGRALLADRRDGARGAWLAAFGLAVAAAFSPLTYVLALPLLVLALLLGLALLARRGSRRKGARRMLAAAVMLVVPPLLLMPWTSTVWAHSPAALAGFGPAASGLADRALRPFDVLLLHPGGPGLPTVWLGVPLLAAALAGLARSRRWRFALAGWAVAATGVTGGVLVARLSTAPLAGGATAPVWPGVATAVAGAGLLMAAVVAADGLFGRLTGSSFGWRQPLAVVLAVTAAAVPVVAAVSWVRGGDRTALDRRDPIALPAFVAAEVSGPTQTRALLLRPEPDGTLRYAVLRRGGSNLGDTDLPGVPGATDRLTPVVRDLAAGRGGAVAGGLAQSAIRYVSVSPPGDERLVRALESSAGLSRVAAGPGVALWEVAGPVGLLTVVAPDGRAAVLPSARTAADARVPAGPAGRVLRLAEPTDAGWRATLDGRALPRRTADGWAQAFELPPAGGHLLLRYDGARRHRELLTQGVLLTVVLLLALPAARRAEEPIAPVVVDDELPPRVIDLRDPADLPLAVRR